MVEIVLLSHTAFSLVIFFSVFPKVRAYGGIPATSSLLRVACGDAQKVRSGAQPHTSVKGLAALCNPAWQAA
jgi:hypothetical protein